MFDIGGIELILIGVVALLVMGDDFPSMFRKLGQFTGKMRKMAREFSRAMEEAADDAGVKDVAKTLKTATSAKAMGLEAVNKAASSLDKWEEGAGKHIKPSDTDAVASDKGPVEDDPGMVDEVGRKAAEDAAMRAKAAAAMSKAAMERRDAEAAAEAEDAPAPEADETTADENEAKA